MQLQWMGTEALESQKGHTIAVSIITVVHMTYEGMLYVSNRLKCKVLKC